MLEALERRRLLAITIEGPDAGGYYVIRGTEAADNFYVDLYSEELRFTVIDHTLPRGAPGHTQTRQNAQGVTIEALGGNDKIKVFELDEWPLDGAFMTSSVRAGNGDDEIEMYDTGRGDVFGGIGNDTLKVFGTREAEVHGEAGNDTIHSNLAELSFLYGGNDNDTITAWGDDPTINDGLYGIWAHGDNGDDVIRGSDDSDRLVGGEGADEIYGNGGDDIISLGDNEDGVDSQPDYGEGGGGHDYIWSEDLTWDWVPRATTEEAQDPFGNGWGWI